MKFLLQICHPENIQIMKKLALFSIIFVVLQQYSFAQKVQVGVIGFYNFENLFDTINDPNKNDDDFTPEGAYRYGTKIYFEKLHNLATVVSQIGTGLSPDGLSLFGVAEVENETVLKDFAAQPEVAGRHYKFVHFESPDSRGIDVALFYNPKYFTVLHAQALFVDVQDGSGFKEKTRDVLYCKGIYQGDTIHVFVNHWPSRRGGEAATVEKRMTAAKVSKRIIDSLMAINPLTKVIDMGDLNDDPVSPSLVKGLKAKGDIKDVKEGELFNPWVDFYKRGLGTLGYNDSWNLFDQIVISYGWLKKDQPGWRYYKAEVFNKPFLVNQFGPYKGYPHRSFDGNNWINGYSDHFPTLIYVVKDIKE